VGYLDLGAAIMRYIYVSRKGGKPMNIGVNRAKRVARSSDKRDRLIVLAHLGSMPKQYKHHQELVLTRHRYYHEQHAEFVRSQSSGDSQP
jgi:hypothetical protein